MRFGVIQFPGSCDERDTLAAAERLGEARLLWHGDRDLRGVDAVILPGGFSYGDYLRPGAIARFSPVMAAVEEWAHAGGLVLGICNGFQVLCEAGLLPGALLPNVNRRFVCRDVELRVEGRDSPFTSGLPRERMLRIPAKHSAGRYHADAQTLSELHSSGSILLRYGPGANFNGSIEDVAGVCNRQGNVFGLMPHPEHAVDALCGSTDGLGIFSSMAAAVQGTARSSGGAATATQEGADV